MARASGSWPRPRTARWPFNRCPGFLSQILVVSALVVLGISVYGLVNQALIKDWTWRLTLLEFVWGPIIGALAGLFIGWLYRVI